MAVLGVRRRSFYVQENLLLIFSTATICLLAGGGLEHLRHRLSCPGGTCSGAGGAWSRSTSHSRLTAAGWAHDASRSLSPHGSQNEQPDHQQQPGNAQQADQQQHGDQQHALPPWRFDADGYDLPPECHKHSLLYQSIFDNLRPWFGRGITKEDMDACVPLAPAGHDLKNGTFQPDPFQARYRLLSWENEVYVTSGGLERPPMAQVPLYYHMITEVQLAARRFGLPNVEFCVAFGDLPADKTPIHTVAGVGKEAAGFPTPMCPSMTYSKFKEQVALLIPSGELHWRDFDEWVQRMQSDGGGVKWEEKEERAVGRWTLFGTTHPHKDRFGRAEGESRQWYVKNKNDTYTSFADGGSGSGTGLPLTAQRKWKYTFSTDGFTTSSRYPKLLATGQVVIKQDSELQEWFYAALQPWQHYVPSGYNGWDEINRIVQYLRHNDKLARSIAANGQRFAATHLVSEGRHCYIKVLFEELAKLHSHRPQRLEDFPSRISYDDELEQFISEEGLQHMAPRPEP